MSGSPARRPGPGETGDSPARGASRARAALGALLLAGCVDLGSETWQPTSVTQGPPVSVPTADAGLSAIDGAAALDGAATDVPAGLPAPACPHPDGQSQPVEIRLVANSFRPPEVLICAGDSVTWVNEDTKEHAIFTGWPGAPDGQIQSPKIYYGKSWTWTFTKPGEFVYYCSTHKKKMQGAKVVVK